MDNQDNSLKKRWLKTTLIVLASAFGISLLFFEGQTLDMIRGNSYYTSSFSILIKELFWPVRLIIPCTIFIVFIGQIVFWLSEAFNHHKSTDKKLYISIDSGTVIGALIGALAKVKDMKI